VKCVFKFALEGPILLKSIESDSLSPLVYLVVGDVVGLMMNDGKTKMFRITMTKRVFWGENPNGYTEEERLPAMVFLIDVRPEGE